MRRDGQYYYAPLRSQWGVWQWHDTTSGGYGDYISSFPTKEESRRFVYSRNGWNMNP